MNCWKNLLQEITVKGDEYLISIRGTTGSFNGHSVISSIVFVSNKRSYGPYPYGGRGAQSHFYVPVQSGKITGFYGRAGDFLDAIGIIMGPLPPSRPTLPLPNQLVQYSDQIINNFISSRQHIIYSNVVVYRVMYAGG